MIYEPVPFVKLVQISLVGKHEPLMGLCGKIFIINLQNLQMLFMSWIETKHSECLAPLHTQETPKWKIFWRRIWPGRRERGRIRGRLPPNLSLPPNFCCAQKLYVENMIKTKIFPSQKCILLPPNLKTGYRPGSDKILSTINLYIWRPFSLEM